MTLYRNEVTEIEIYDYDNEVVGKVKCFDAACSEITVKEHPHTVDSWRELSAQIEAALLAIHPAN